MLTVHKKIEMYSMVDESHKMYDVKVKMFHVPSIRRRKSFELAFKLHTTLL